jgi:hypothetical protein
LKIILFDFVFFLKASGVKVDNSVIEKFHEFKIKKNTGYLVLGFSDDISKIVVLNEGVNKVPQNAPAEEKSKKKKILTFCYWNYLDQKWAEMLDALPENDVRYAVIDIFYDTNEGSRAEIYFIAW